MQLSRQAITTAIILGVLAFVGLWFAGNYNSLVHSKNAVDNSWSKVETQYQRRLDTIDNLAVAVKSAQGQESKVFGQIADARANYNKATTTDQKAAAASQIESINIVPRLQEAYPELKSNAQVQSLMDSLQKQEVDIAGVRNTYNDTVTNYNNNITSFPKNIFAGIFGFDKAQLFKSETGASKGVKLQL
jgi:LemA protein